MLNIDVGKFKVREGSSLVANRHAETHSICRKGERVKVVGVVKHGPDGTLIGIRSPQVNKGWHSLEGMVEEGHGLWCTIDCIADNFELDEPIYKICGTVEVKKKNLHGMKCRILSTNKNGEFAFVEVEENVGGGSADGQGKMGHCVIVSTSDLTAEKKHH